MINRQLRQKLTKLARFNRKRRQHRAAKFEQLEVRHLLAAAVWTNVLQPLDVSNNDGTISPLDALLVINELNLSAYAARHEPLPLEIPDTLHPPFIDVTCDGFVSPIDALLVINRLNNRDAAPLSSPSAGQPTWKFSSSENSSTAGKYLFNTCSPQLVEGSFYTSQFSTHLNLPDNTTAIQVKFDTPIFDRSSQQTIRDAFEILVLDDAGQPLVLPYSPGRDAAFNWSEGMGPTSGPATKYASGIATINLSGIAAGTSVHIVTRLDNNDLDNTSSVIVRGISFIDSPTAAPTSFAPIAQSPLQVTAPELTSLVDVSGSLIANYGATSISETDNSVLTTQLSIENAGTFSVTGRLIAAIDGISEPNVHVIRPDGFLQDGRPYFDLTSQLAGGTLAPGQTLGPREISFQNRSEKRFGFHVSLFSQIANPPSRFLSVPLESIEAGKRYQYVASATEPSQTPLQYSIVTAPESLTIDANTGELNWQTLTSDVGSHSVTVRATNKFGLSVDQSFTIRVQQSIPNRPPIFTSTPGTEATAASGFEVLTLATGKNPTGLATGDFGSGNTSLVAINAGDQSLSYLAGVGSENFAAAETVSVGEPRPTGSVIRSSIGVDLGLPAYINPNRDSNFIDTFASADFNGDGKLDSVTIAFVRSNSVSGTYSESRYMIVNLGNGDGTFQAPTRFDYPSRTGNLESGSMLAMDFDRDGRIDLLNVDIVSGGANNPVYFIKGRGDGTFNNAVRLNISTTFNTMRAADFDGDGKVDLLVQQEQQNALGIMFGNGDGTFANTVDLYTFPSGGFSIDAYTFGDVDGDGDLDVAVADWGRSKITVLTNRGDKTFSIGADFSSQLPLGATGTFGNPSAVVVGDFSGDGKADIAYATYSQSSPGGGIGLYIGDGSGTQFTYQLAQSDRIPYRPQTINGNSGPVDIDRDGDLDLILMSNAGSAVEQNGFVVGINDGRGHFTTTHYLDAGNGDNQQNSAPNNSRIVGAFLDDFNRDGMLDLLSAESNREASSDFSRLNVLLADQPGKFRAPTAIPLEKAAFGSISFLMSGDFNNDGVADLWGPQYQGVSVTRLGNGDGTFRSGITATPYIGNETLGPGFVADLNNDGNQDVVWIGGGGIQGGPAPRYLAALGNGDGTFQISYVQSAVTRTLAPGDFNHDGLMDFAARGDHNFAIMLNNPASPGTFTQSVKVPLNPAGEDSPAFEVDDFDGDGNLDVVVVLTDSNRPPHRLQFYHGNGDGTVNAALTTSILTNTELLFPKWLASADLNGDGIVDLAMTAAYSRSAVMLGKGDGTFGDAAVYVAGTFFASFGTDLMLRDVNGDGNLDMVNMDDRAGLGRLTIRLGAGNGTFGEQQAYDSTSPASTLASADFDNDGHEDFIFLNLANYGESVVFTGSRPGLTAVASVDMNGDGKLDVLAINDDNGHVKRLLGNGRGDFARQPDLLVGAGPVALETGDFNDDGKVDFVTANRSGKTLSVMLADNSGSFTRSDIPLDAIPLDIQAADLNGDGTLDLSVIDVFHNTLQILIGLGTGKFQLPKPTPLGDRPSSLTLSDTDGDGRLDAVITLPQSNRVMLLPGQGDGTFAAPKYVTTSSIAQAVAAADLNQDGRGDLVVALPEEDQVAVLFGIGSNRFAEPQKIRVGDQPNSLVLQDANGDGRSDILVTNAGDSTASVILNKYDPTKVYHYQAVAVDPDADPIAYTVVSGPGGMIFDQATGEVRWAPSADQVGLQKVVLQASDGRGGLTTQQFTIAVAPAQNNATPVFTSQPVLNVAADTSFTYSATAIDNDNDTLRYRLVSGPTGATIDPTSGTVDWDARSGGLKFNESNNNGGVQIPNSPSLALSSFTIEGWFSFDATSNQTLIWKDAPLQYPFHGASYGLRYQWGNLLAIIGDGSSEGEVSSSIPWTPILGQAYHIAGTFDAATGSLKLLINGTVVSEKTTSKRIYIYDLPLFLGYANQDPFFGTMSNVRVWNAARSSAEIINGLDREFDSSTPNLVAEYRFKEEGTMSIVDATGRQLNGMLYGTGWPRRVVGISTVRSADFTIRAEDGRGGVDEQSFRVQIVSRLRGNIAGTVFSDTNGNGSQQSGEAALAGFEVYVDANGNSQRDATEMSATTDANGQYLLTNLVSGNYEIRVIPRAGFVTDSEVNAVVVGLQTATANVPLALQPPGQLRGKVLDDQAKAAAHMQVFADLDRDSLWDANEPVSWTDDLGKYAIGGLEAGNYSVRVNSRPSWTTTTPNAAAHDVVLATNATLNDLDFIVKPNSDLNRNQPVIVSAPNLSAQARTTYSDFVFAYSPDNSKITYSLAVAPSGMVVDPNTGRVVWMPTVGQIGTQRVIVRAINESGSVALQDFEIEVVSPNSAPIVTSKPSSPITAGKPFRYAIEAQDAEQTSLKYSMLSGPVRAAVDLNSGVVTWTPTTANVGKFDFVVAVSDGVGGVAQQAFALTVVSGAVNTVPFVIQTPRGDASLLSKYLSRIDGVDATGQGLTTELRSGPSGLTLDSTGLIQWMPTTNQIGPHTVSVRYHSPTGATEDHQFTITVKQVVGNSNPTINSSPTLFATVEQLYTYDVFANDGDHDALAYELVSVPAGMSINAKLGTIRWLPARDQRGAATVTIRVSDPQGGSATQTFSLNTRTVGGPPSITSIPPTQAVVGQGFLYSVLANDAEADPLNYTLLQAPAGMTIDARSGEIAWTPTVGQIGQQSVIISVADAAGGASTQGFAIQVLVGAPNLPPVIASEPILFSTVGQNYVYDLLANDPEGTRLTYALRRNPSGMQIDSTSGRVSWTPTEAQSGRTVVSILATDAAGGIALQSFELDVLAANHAPAFISATSMTVFAGATLMYDAVARDADLDPLSYEIVSGALDGMAIDAFGRIRWTAKASDIGTHAIQVRARDPRGGVATQTLALQVLADNVAPKVTVLPTPGGWPWDGPIVVFVSAVDNVAVTDLELKVNDRVVPLDANRMARLFADDWGFGVMNMVATARDAAGNVGSGTGVSFYRNPDVDYEANPAKPTAIVTSPAVDSSVVGMVRVEGTAGGPDFKEYRLSYARADQQSFTEFAHSTSKVTDGLLGTWDTTLLENDAYVIRLEVTDVIGSTSVVDVPVGLSGALKLGNFRLSFEDMTIPVAGIPITIVRTYDTLRADRDGDFGYGWRLEYRNTDLRTSLPKSGLEDIGIYTPFKQGTKVYITLPNGGRQGFTFTPDIKVLPGFGQNNNLILASPRFTPDLGVTSTLNAGSGQLTVNEFGELYSAGGIPWNPASPDFGGYTLTTQEGVQYRIDGATGLMNSAQDRNGNRIDFSDSGVTGGGGAVEIRIERDLAGRIAAIVDPLGNAIRYEYSSTSDLLRVIDREGNSEHYAYLSNPQHFMREIVSPDGRKLYLGEFDSSGRLVSMKTPGDQRIVVDYDPLQKRETLVDDFGHRTQVVYDDFGNVVLQADALGNTSIRVIDDQNRLISETDPVGAKTEYTYDSLGRLATVKDALGGVTAISQNNRSEIVAVVSPLGDTKKMIRDAQGRPTSVIDALGNEIQFEYDRQGNLTHEIDAEGFESRNTYNPLGYLIESVDKAGQRIQYDYSPTGQLIRQRSSRLQSDGTRIEVQTSSNFDKNGRQVSSTDSEGHTTRTRYDSSGRVFEKIDALGRSTRYEYDDRGNQVLTTYPNGATERREYNQQNELVATIDPLGNRTEYVYNALGKWVQMRFPGDEAGRIGTIEREYDAAGRVAAEVEENGARTRRTYDELGRMVSTIDAMGFESRMYYDARGLSLTVDPQGRETRYERDAAGQVLAVIAPDGSRTQQKNDANGRLIEQTDALGNTTRFERDGLGRLTGVTDPLGHRTSYVLDEAGNTIRIVDAMGRTTTNRYDSRGNKVETKLPLGQLSRWSYDAVGNMIQYFDANSKQIDFEYDSIDQLVRKHSSDSTDVEFSYDLRGLLVTASNDAGTVHLDYDNRRRLIRRTDAIDAVVNYAYGTNNQIATRTLGGASTNYVYDANGRVISMVDASGDYHFQYDAVGNLLEIDYPNGVVTKNQFDAQNRVTNIATSLGATALQDLEYEYDLVGNRTSLIQDAKTVRYDYDPNRRLVKETDSRQGINVTEYSYDAVGNRIRRQVGNAIPSIYTYDENDRLVLQTGATGQSIFAYDEVGNLIEEKLNGQLQKTYTWDVEGMLRSIDSHESGGLDSSYQYDPFGNRQAQIINDEPTFYVLDTVAKYPNVLEERTGNGTVSVSYTRGPVLLAQSRGQDQSYYHIDALGSVVALSDRNGQIINEYQYDAYGRVLVTSEGVENSLGYTGEFQSADGTVYLRSRYLSTETGRFLSADTFQGSSSLPISQNKYLYAHASPANWNDPSGKSPSLEGMVVTAIQSYLVMATASVITSVAQVPGNHALYRDVLNLRTSSPAAKELLWALSFEEERIGGWYAMANAYGNVDAAEHALFGDTEVLGQAVTSVLGAFTILVRSSIPYTAWNVVDSAGGRFLPRREHNIDFDDGTQIDMRWFIQGYLSASFDIVALDPRLNANAKRIVGFAYNIGMGYGNGKNAQVNSRSVAMGIAYAQFRGDLTSLAERWSGEPPAGDGYKIGYRRVMW